MKFLSLINQKLITEIKISDKYLHRHPSEITIRYNKTKYQIRTVVATILTVLCMLGAINQLDKEQPEYFFIIVIVVGLLLGYFIIHNLIRALNNNPILTINYCGIKINEKPVLNWDSINSIYIKKYNSEEGNDYNLCIDSEILCWKEDFTSFDLRIEEISHWLAYFKLKHTEDKKRATTMANKA